MRRMQPVTLIATFSEIRPKIKNLLLHLVTRQTNGKDATVVRNIARRKFATVSSNTLFGDRQT